MGELLKGYFVPNGSYLMEEDEDGEHDISVEVLRGLGREIQEGLRADAVVIASPHWQPRRGFFVDDSPAHTSFTDYPLRPFPWGRRPFSFEAQGAPGLARALIRAGQEAGLPVAAMQYGLDHGAFCPLCVMKIRVPVVPVSISQRSFEETRRWGRALAQGILASDRRVVVVAPGNLCHRLDMRLEEQREAYYPRGTEFDELCVKIVTEGRFGDLERIDPALLRDAAPEAGLRPLALLEGLTGGTPGKLLAYHGMKYSVGDATFEFVPRAA